MIQRSIFAASALCGALLWSAAAAADPGTTTGNVNMRSGPGTQFSVVTTIPAGAPIEVFDCQSWCQVGYGGRQGYVSANYVGGGYAEPGPRAYYQPAPVYEPAPMYEPAPAIGFYFGQRPWYEAPRHWRDDHRRYYRRGDGAYLQFGF